MPLVKHRVFRPCLFIVSSSCACRQNTSIYQKVFNTSLRRRTGDECREYIASRTARSLAGWTSEPVSFYSLEYLCQQLKRLCGESASSAERRAFGSKEVTRQAGRRTALTHFFSEGTGSRMGRMCSAQILSASCLNEISSTEKGLGLSEVRKEPREQEKYIPQSK
ncbi:hypothetical protein MPTK1_8g08790 [Marchantia polymorpha subsp. ruderalis]|uniref:Uncharacterized protein n=1 Tax=Marchantia polymorpha TaxID=3197 RepID=A0A2R6WRL1_MARPO|nr:hypothetical protein MARPO_0063s0039 [Marchantia polymorpha]BBN19220.1 hypothetical protein Mp_8g08790 [Marchantia polymorpha subsp. ruderalis]|eukprot:PTQ36491.1 hypothetical protein MARPO_0063s0039 [Marchantia polymorpha]